MFFAVPFEASGRPTQFAQSRAMSLCATGKVCVMRTEKKVIEFADCIVTVIVRPKKPPAVNNDNEPYDFWNEELQELYNSYDK